MVLARFYAHESCGQCTPCRESTGWIYKMVHRIVDGHGRKDDLDTILDVAKRGAGTTICAFYDGAVGPYISYIEKFRAEFEALVQQVMPKLTIDGKEIEVAAGTNLIEAARRLGIEVPHYCYHPGLSIAGQCRLCMVDIEKTPRPTIACNTHGGRRHGGAHARPTA